MSSISHQIATNSAAVADRMQETGQLARGVGGSLDEMMAAMHGILESSRKISKIIKVIDEIAFQTNILALNAAVEAARAGDAGMGFAVVANEVRNLAHRSAAAASETASLIEESIARSANGNDKVQGVAGAIRTITQNSLQVESAIQGVRSSTQQQVAGMEQIATAVARIQKVTEATAAHAEQSAAISHELSNQADLMNQAVDVMAQLVGGNLEMAELEVTPVESAD
jgi:methyl-accepting chemotaxis protein